MPEFYLLEMDFIPWIILSYPNWDMTWLINLFNTDFLLPTTQTEFLTS